MAASTQALVIGNGAYSSNLGLVSPPNDARAVAAVLSELQIEVILGIDLDFEGTRRIVDRFIEIVTRSTTTSSILYYSGHAVQDGETNYIVPIDFDKFGADNLTKLIGVQGIVDRMTSESAIRIILLDACRSNIDARLFIKDKNILVDANPKAFFVGEESLPQEGLAEMRAASDTFIAFAASPGDLAYDGIAGSVLSPFTKALVRHLDAVDLPIANLTSRVRTEVLSETMGLQRTWDQSSLMAPFYFNPGSQLMFTGNVMSLAGLIISMWTYTLVLRSEGATSAQAMFVAMALPMLCLLIFLYGTQSVYARLRGARRDSGTTQGGLGRIISNSFSRGISGGFLGSVFSSVVLAIPYYNQWEHPVVSFGQILLEITVGTMVAACPLGFLSLLLAQVFRTSKRWKSSDRPWLTILTGSSIGGVLAGGISAPFLTAHFGSIADRPEMTPSRLLPGAIVGAALLVFTIISFDFERLSRRRLRSTAIASVLSLLSGAVATAVVFGPLWAFGIVSAVTTYLEDSWSDPIRLAEGGVAYGMPVGLILGFVIGSAIVVAQRLSRKPVLE